MIKEFSKAVAVLGIVGIAILLILHGKYGGAGWVTGGLVAFLLLETKLVAELFYAEFEIEPERDRTKDSS